MPNYRSLVKSTYRKAFGVLKRWKHEENNSSSSMSSEDSSTDKEESSSSESGENKTMHRGRHRGGSYQ